MLTVPMLSAHDEVIGVVQLINRRRRADRALRTPADFDENVVPFDAGSEQLALALASQAGICLENAILYEEIQNLFAGFVDAAVTAIESRDPTTSGHSRRVATLTVALAERVDALDQGPFASLHFTRDELRQIEYAGVLHDFGKVGVRENVLTKAKKLYEAQRDAIALRFRYIRKSVESEALQQKLAWALAGRAAEPELFAALDRDTARRLRELEEIGKLLATANEPALLAGPAAAQLAEVARLEYIDCDGARRPYLEPGELEALRIERGSLTDGERQQIQSHVTHTLSFLEAIPWSRKLRDVPRIAGRPPRVARRPRLPLRPAGRRDPGRVAHDDHRRHLRRPHRRRPPLQGGRPGPPRALDHRVRGQGRPLRPRAVRHLRGRRDLPPRVVADASPPSG